MLPPALANASGGASSCGAPPRSGRGALAGGGGGSSRRRRLRRGGALLLGAVFCFAAAANGPGFFVLFGTHLQHAPAQQLTPAQQPISGGTIGGAAGCDCDRNSSTAGAPQQERTVILPPPPLRHLSALERLYEETSQGTDLRSWARLHVLRTYPSLPDDGGLMVGNPSLAHDPETNRTVVGFRIQTKSMPMALRRVRYLMLCEILEPTSSSSSDAVGGTKWRCQDSGWDNSYVPPECDPAHWTRPRQSLAFQPMVIGPEDARLYFQEDGNLGATVMLRGCHPTTRYGNGTALWSVYATSWARWTPTAPYSNSNGGGGMWRRFDYPKLLELRRHDGSPLGDDYPIVTKSWISIPRRRSPEQGGGANEPQRRHASLATNPDGLRYSVGWTRGMKEHIVYRIAVANVSMTGPASDTMHPVVPVRPDSADFSQADLAMYRASTNVVEFRGALLGLGHRQVRTPRLLYQHYWYAFCPDEPYRAVALGEPFLLSQGPRAKITFALGLAAEGRHLYATFSVWDKTPHLVRFDSDDVWESLRNSTLYHDAADAAARNGTRESAVDFTPLCSTDEDAAASALAKG